MMIENTNWYWLMLPAVLICYELAVVLLLRRRVARLAASQASLKASVQEATALSVGLVRTNRALRGRLEILKESLGQLQLASTGRPYDQAISLAEQGEAPERLASCFGLTMGEAKLVSLLHGQE
jgi:hypothetical protein